MPSKFTLSSLFFAFSLLLFSVPPLSPLLSSLLFYTLCSIPPTLRLHVSGCGILDVTQPILKQQPQRLQQQQVRRNGAQVLERVGSSSVLFNSSSSLCFCVLSSPLFSQRDTLISDILLFFPLSSLSSLLPRFLPFKLVCCCLCLLCSVVLCVLL